MARLLRPHVPLSVRVAVALRQLKALRFFVDRNAGEPDSEYLPRVLGFLGQFHDNEPLQLDHDPALENREKVYRHGRHVGYVPDANDPAHLVYRNRHDHHIKTNVRGDGAQYPDRVLAKRERRRANTSKPEQTRPLKSANRWPPKGSRKVNWRRS